MLMLLLGAAHRIDDLANTSLGFLIADVVEFHITANCRREGRSANQGYAIRLGIELTQISALDVLIDLITVDFLGKLQGIVVENAIGILVFIVNHVSTSLHIRSFEGRPFVRKRILHDLDVHRLEIGLNSTRLPVIGVDHQIHGLDLGIIERVDATFIQTSLTTTSDHPDIRRNVLVADVHLNIMHRCIALITRRHQTNIPTLFQKNLVKRSVVNHCVFGDFDAEVSVAGRIVLLLYAREIAIEDVRIGDLENSFDTVSHDESPFKISKVERPRISRSLLFG
nr:MAG TPA: hypothetical protein [Caudoviricetes sp.]